jgi:chromosome partitioning protein
MLYKFARTCKNVNVKIHRMKKIVVAGSKGGSGKSTISIALADFLKGSKIVDADNQGSISSAAAMGGRHQPIHLMEDDLSSIEHLIFDTPPYLSEELPEIIRQADVILLPTMVGQFDLIALKGVIDLIRKEGKQACTYIVFNAVKKPITKTFLRTKNFFLSNYKDIRKSKVELSYLMAYHTLPERALWGRAKKEIEKLAKEVNLYI